MEGARDWVDDHVDRWQSVLPDLNPDIEGAVTRMQFLADHLRRVSERSLAEFGLRREEHEALHVLVRRGWRTTVTQLAMDLATAPGTLDERLDALEKRGFVVRTRARGAEQSAAAAAGEPGEQGDEIELTDEGHATWLRAIETSGQEERRLLGTLDWHEQRLISSLLRRVVLTIEGYDES
ncbi:MarR family transcriptional regulator [Streptomyces albus subsp. chlorinus]|nr:MarR family transcriptional regulator [Streptomyces albus subsp. chlorinus]